MQLKRQQEGRIDQDLQQRKASVDELQQKKVANDVSRPFRLHNYSLRSATTCKRLYSYRIRGMYQRRSCGDESTSVPSHLSSFPVLNVVLIHSHRRNASPSWPNSINKPLIVSVLARSTSPMALELAGGRASMTPLVNTA